MTEHPLTLAQIKKLARRYTCDMESGEYSFGEDTVRAAADWQLTKVLEWLDENISHYTDSDYLGDCGPVYELESDLKKAMRPIQED